MRLEGQPGQNIILQGPSVFPPIVEVDGGFLSHPLPKSAVNYAVLSGADVALMDCTFPGGASNGVLWVQELPSTPPFVRLERCTFQRGDGEHLGRGQRPRGQHF